MLGPEIWQTKSDTRKQGQFFCGTSGADREDVRVSENRFRELALRHHCTAADRIWACSERALVNAASGDSGAGKDFDIATHLERGAAARLAKQ